MQAKLTPEELHQMVLAKADATWLQLRKAYRKIQIIRPAVKYNKRLKTTAGRAFYDSVPPYVDLSHDLLWEHPHEMVHVTLPHELAHVAAWQQVKDGGHGMGWKNIMVYLGLPPERCHDLTNTLHETRKMARMAGIATKDLA